MFRYCVKITNTKALTMPLANPPQSFAGLSLPFPPIAYRIDEIQLMAHPTAEKTLLGSPPPSMPFPILQLPAELRIFLENGRHRDETCGSQKSPQLGSFGKSYTLWQTDTSRRQLVTRHLRALSSTNLSTILSRGVPNLLHGEHLLYRGSRLSGR